MEAGAFPRVVALVPAWKASEFIEETLAALAAQTWPNLEVLVSDDASPDGTADICERFAERDPRFRVVRQPKNLGWTGNINALLAAADGDFLFFAFHDDLIAPTYVERLACALVGHPGAVVAYSDMELRRPNGTREISTYRELDGLSDRVARGRKLILRRGRWWVAHRGLFRAGAARRIGGLRRHGGGEFAADWPWQVHLGLLGEYVRVPEVLCFKRHQARSLSLTWRYTPRSWLAVAFSCAREIRGADLRAREKAALLWCLAWSTGWSLAAATARRAAGKLGIR